MFDVGIFLARISLLIPVLTSFLACATWVYGAYVVINRLDLSVVQSLGWITDNIGNAIVTIQAYSDSRFFDVILDCTGLSDAADCLIYLCTYLSLLSESIIAILALLTTGIIAVWVYRKTKMVCNVLSASGASE